MALEIVILIPLYPSIGGRKKRRFIGCGEFSNSAAGNRGECFGSNKITAGGCRADLYAIVPSRNNNSKTHA